MKLVILLILFISTVELVFAEHNKLSKVQIKGYYLAGSGWNKEVIEEKFRKANDIMKKCGVKLEMHGSLLRVETNNTDGSVNLISDSEPEFRVNEMKIHDVIETKRNDGFVRMMFVGKINNLISVLGVSRRKELHAGEIYENSIYITNQLGIVNVDQTIAHEFGHVLLNEGHYFADPSPNIMHYQEPQQDRSFTKRQCQKMLASHLVN